MTKLNLDDAPVFLAVARTGTLTAAAKQLGTGIATISRKIERLEEALGVTLFLRHQTGYKLTEEGQTLLPRAEAFEEAAHGFRVNEVFGTEAVGHVRIATAENLANELIIPSLAPLLKSHPELTVEVLTDITAVNLHRQDADIAVRMVRPERGNLTVRKIGNLGYGLYGSQAYLNGRATMSAATQNGDKLIGWAERQHMLPAAQWMEGLLKGGAASIATSSLMGQISAAKAGLGLAVLPHFLALDAGLALVSDNPELDQDIWLVVHSDLVTSRRIKIVAEHLAQVMLSNATRLAGR